MTVPNIITLIRFLIIPFYTYYLIRGYFLYSLILFIISALSDILDGYLARKLNQTSELGKILDPLSDKLIILISLIYFGSIRYFSPIGVIVFILKELIMLVVGLVFLIKKVEIISSRIFGKLATVFTSISVIMGLLRISFANIVFLIGLLFSLLAGLDYLFIYLKKLRVF